MDSKQIHLYHVHLAVLSEGDVEMRIILLSSLLLLCTSNVVNGFFGGKKEKEEKKIGAKESVALGIDMMMQAASDPSSLKEAMSMLNDPATRKEVESMMADPAFKKEMEKMKNNPVYMNAVQGAKEMLVPQPGANSRGKTAPQEVEEISDADLGMQQLMKAAKDPKMIADAAKMMEDPEIAAQVSIHWLLSSMSITILPSGTTFEYR